MATVLDSSGLEHSRGPVNICSMNELEEDGLVVKGVCIMEEGFCFYSEEIEHIYVFARPGETGVG